jgi:hypothetical protein
MHGMSEDTKLKATIPAIEGKDSTQVLSWCDTAKGSTSDTSAANLKFKFSRAQLELGVD